MAGAQPRPVAEALLPASLLEGRDGRGNTLATRTSRRNPPHPLEGVQRQQTHLLRRHHGDDGHSLLPDHLPEILARAVEGPLRGDVVPLLATGCDLTAEKTSEFTTKQVHVQALLHAAPGDNVR